MPYAKHELDEHLALLTERMAGLSTIQVRKEIATLQESVRAPGADQELIGHELSALSALVASRQPPIPSPQQRLEAMRAHGDTAAADMLAWSMERQQLQEAVTAAQAICDENARNGASNSTATSRLAEAEQALADYPAPPFVLQKQAQDAARAEGQALVRQSTIALTEAERDSLLAQSEEKFAQARGEQPPTPTPASAPPPQDYLAAAEAAVAKAMAANA